MMIIMILMFFLDDALCLHLQFITDLDLDTNRLISDRC